MESKHIVYAKDYKCDECDEQAVVFVGIADPDAGEYPKCRKHADEYTLRVQIALFLDDLYEE